MRIRPRLLVAAVVLGMALIALAAFHGRGAAARYTTATVDRGEIVDVVGATGILQAVTTVQVGSQVSGTIQSLGADFNSKVHRGQVVARLDPSLFEARVAQMKATLTTASANVERSKAAVEDARLKYERARSLSAQQLLPDADLDTAKATYAGASAELKGAEAAVEQARANLSQAQVDLDHTVITAPIDGVVIARSVDVGQTVAASFTAPVLFQIANDLTQMEVNASIDEADIGRVQSGQDVTFRVDAYPDRSFSGSVQQVRLQPITNQNVVTYNTIVTVSNKDLKLMPGMTATVSVVVDKRQDVLRVPAAALRFRPAGFEERRAASGSASPGPRPARQGQGGQGARPARVEGQGQRPSLVFVPDESGRPQPTRVKTGISDGRFVEVTDGLTEGAAVITAEEGGRSASGSGAQGSNPFAPGRPQPRTR